MHGWLDRIAWRESGVCKVKPKIHLAGWNAQQELLSLGFAAFTLFWQEGDF